jgi:hypothetical protein
MDLLALLDSIVERLTGPWGVVVLLVICLYFVWRLFRETQRALAASDLRVDSLTEAVRDLTTEIRERKR